MLLGAARTYLHAGSLIVAARTQYMPLCTECDDQHQARSSASGWSAALMRLPI